MRLPAVIGGLAARDQSAGAGRQRGQREAVAREPEHRDTHQRPHLLERPGRLFLDGDQGGQLLPEWHSRIAQRHGRAEDERDADGTLCDRLVPTGILPESRDRIREHGLELTRILADRDGSPLGVTILSSDMGKLYVALAQAIERIRS